MYRKENVELHPLVRQNIIPKHLADVFFYTPPLEKTKSQSSVVKTARVVSSEEVKQEIREKEQKKKNRLLRKVQEKPKAK